MVPVVARIQRTFRKRARIVGLDAAGAQAAGLALTKTPHMSVLASVRNCCSGSPSRSAAGPTRSRRLISATSIRPDRLRISIWRRCAKGWRSYRAAPPTRAARITVIRSISSWSGTDSRRFSHSSGADGGLTSLSIFTALTGRLRPSCSAANISTHRSARCMFSDGSRTSHCRRRGTP
jgi:hypothetical protein